MKGIIQGLYEANALAPADMEAYKNKYKDYTDVQNKAKGMKLGGKVSSASKRADGIAIRGKTRA